MAKHDRYDTYVTPLVSRWASSEMCSLWSDRTRAKIWRRLWIALARAERALGLPITKRQIAELEAHAEDINFDAVARYERKLRHDVMAHVRAWGDQCPAAAGIIHLGATSCFVADNAEIVVMAQALELLIDRAVATARNLAKFARKYRKLPTLGFTHFQPAQPTTVGKRACLWLQDVLCDLEALDGARRELKFRGVKGTTGTQASFLRLFDGDHAKVRRLEKLVAKEMGFTSIWPVTGQTYPRKADYKVLAVLSGCAQSASKFATDLRLLAHRKELEEPFEAGQVGSSAMAYKRNPMRAERITGLARYIIVTAANAAHTAATQWLERTLDDSANRRLALAESFLATDAVWNLYQDVSARMVVYEKVIRASLEAELPFMASEDIMMAAVKAGGDRQELHERIRRHALAAASRVKAQGKDNDFLARLEADPAFRAVDVRALARAENFVGRSPEQVLEFLEEVVKPTLGRYRRRKKPASDVRV